MNQLSTLDAASRPTVAAQTRKFLPQELRLNAWEDIQSYFTNLESRSLDSLDDLETWLRDLSELEAVLAENLAWRYIRMTIDTTNDQFGQDYQLYITEIQPKQELFSDIFNKKLLACNWIKDLSADGFFIFLRSVKKEVALFRDENIALNSKVSQESQQYGVISGKQTVTYQGEEITMQKANSLLKDTNRTTRKQVYNLIAERRKIDRDELEELFSRLTSTRNQIATNAGFNTFRDYKFEALGRFDYTKEDCFAFHNSISKEIKPIVEDFHRKRLKILGYESLKPFDLEVDLEDRRALKPYINTEDLLEKCIAVFTKIRPFYGECLRTMKEMGHLDLESKTGKAPGGYNYPLYETGIPFIFMNSVGTQRDLVTLIHEGGHAIHSFLSRNLSLTRLKNVPSEVAELASMSMELISMEHWNVFYPVEEDLKRAKLEQLQTVLRILPWIATVDKFQHWLYENKGHSATDRKKAWVEICTEFSSSIVDWRGYEENQAYTWQQQLHIFEVPFYYIEYGFAQLGAIALWRNYKHKGDLALDQFDKALSLGYTATIPEIYKAAGIEFNFSREYVRELAAFIKKEIQRL